jgi:hypothetical protein
MKAFALFVILLLVVPMTVDNNPQTFHIGNVIINGDLYTSEPPVPANADACKNDGWQQFTRHDGTSFTNQGDCIQYVTTGK